MVIAMGCDSAGYELKTAVKEYLQGKGYDVRDVGMISRDDQRTYYHVASEVAKIIQRKQADRGILFCGTGMGVAIVANKFRGVYAAVVEGSFTAKMCAAINKANVLTMGGWIVGPGQAKDMVDRWLSADFTEGFDDDLKKFLVGAFDQVREIERITMKEDAL